jgi:hypothetical protein
VNRNIFYENGIQIIKGNISELQSRYDLIVLKDSLEHMPNQHEVLRQIRRLTEYGSYVLIIMPIVGHAWRTYGPNWVGLDAPRHFYIHSEKSIELLCYESGFEILVSVYDSNEDQFIGSEQYVKDIPIFDQRSYYVNQNNSLFSRRQITEFREKAKQLNTIRDGDRIYIILKRI